MKSKSKKSRGNKQNGSGTGMGLRRWYRQRRGDKEFNHRTGLAVVSFFPGGGKAHFEQPIQPLGLAIMAVLWYRLSQVGAKLLRTMPFRGYTAEGRSDGTVVYGGDRGVEFSYDLGARPIPNARGRVLDSEKHDGLILRGMAMDKATDNVREPWKLPIVPIFPKILVGLPSMPDFVETPALLTMACTRFNCSMKELAKNPLREQYLHKLFSEAALSPTHEANHTGGFLFPVDFLPMESVHGCAFYEDFRELLGVNTWNPARDIHDLGANALKACGFDRGHMAALNENQLNQVVAKMREKLGPHGGLFTIEELVDALVEGKPPVKADGTTLQIAIGDPAYLQLLRSFLTPDVAAQAIDTDLLVAAAELNAPLTLTRVVKPQVIQLQALPVEQANGWTPEVLGRKILAELEVDNLRARPRRSERKERKNADSGTVVQPALVVDVRRETHDDAVVADVA